MAHRNHRSPEASHPLTQGIGPAMEGPKLPEGFTVEPMKATRSSRARTAKVECLCLNGRVEWPRARSNLDLRWCSFPNSSSDSLEEKKGNFLLFGCRA